MIQVDQADEAGRRYTLYYPSTLASDGFRNPLITYGNGSFATCTGRVAQAFGRHLASWGFAVVCANSSQTGFGTEILQAVNFMVAENTRAGSVFHGELDTDAIGAAGHSQGATGALNANTKSSGAIRSTVALAFVDPEQHGSDQPRLADLNGPVFLASGCDDPLSTRQNAYFDEIRTPVVKACRVGAAHDMVAVALDYVTAWFMFTLRGDSVARGAFIGADAAAPEVALDPDWRDWRSKRFP